MRKPISNPLLTKADWKRQRKEALNDPGRFHGEIAKREIYWYEPKLKGWIKRVNGENPWVGFKNGKPLKNIKLPKDYNPWKRAFNDSTPPFYRWFEGGLTNACFNEVDVHVMNGYGDEIAFIFEGDRWDPSLNKGKGGPVVQEKITRKKLLWEVAKYAQMLKDLGLKKGDRIALNMPNILEQIYFTEAAKRLGVIYTPVFGGFSAKTLADRIQNSGAKVVITVDGSHRNAQIVPFKEVYTDKALDDYIPFSAAIEAISKTLKTLNLSAQITEKIKNSVQSTITGEITVDRSEVMRGIGNALEKILDWDPRTKSKVRTAFANSLVKAHSQVSKTVVVQHAKIPDVTWNPSRDIWAHDLLEKATDKILKKGKIPSEKKALALPTEKFIQLVNASVPVEPVDAEFPLFIIYTSGSTGKPKGVVHTHGGYIAGIAHTMRISFDVKPDAKKPDVIYVIADPGWITGQSYMISAALTTRTTSIITEGPPLFPNAGRFTSIIERYKVTIFKAGSTFLKAITSDPESIADLKKYDCSSLRVGTFCAEPVNPSIQKFAMSLLTPQYINSYWATEHGGIVLTHFYGSLEFPLRPDAHTYPLPWVLADIWIPEKEKKGRFEPRLAKNGEKGELVITQPYPYLARTIWGDSENVGKPSWKGDIERFEKIYFGKWRNGTKTLWVYTQGDYASKYSDGSMRLHGRCDDVINTSGHRLGTEEIEGAILKEKQINPKTPIGNVIVVGAPDKEKGTVPLAFTLTIQGKKLSLNDEKRLINLVREEKGAVAVPAGFITVSQFPETRSGKYMRRYIKNILNDKPLGDTSTLRNPDSLIEIAESIQQWKAGVSLKEEQKILEVLSTLRIEYHKIKANKKIAILTISKPPVNALNERALDELNTAIEHLNRRADIKVVIITGAGTKSFVAGADIRQFLEEMYTVEDVLPLPHKADIAICSLENMKKPVIAAINGLALGGGNEFQMGAHYRIAESSAKFGQPEINLHLIPGYGGTQRLPKLLSDHLGEEEGLIQAAEIILGGRSVSAEKAKEIGLIDEIATGTNALSSAVNLAREYILSDKPNTTKLGKAYTKRLKLNKKWSKPKKFPKNFRSNPKIKQLISQGKLAGRQLPIKSALKAIKIGHEKGFDKGLEMEAKLFAEAVINPLMGKFGIQAFFDKQSAPLPIRYNDALQQARKGVKKLKTSGDLIPIGAPFYPGVTPLPQYQYAQLVERDPKTGIVNHGDPTDAEKLQIIPVSKPMPNEALLYMLTSEINFNDIWAITGVPVSTFDIHDEDWHVSGSGGVGLVVETGSEMKEEGRIKVGDLVAVFSGQSELLSPLAGLDPMFANQKIQGYETPDGSHQQFMIAQGPQLFPKLPDLTLEAAGSYMLNLGTIYRALFTTLKIKPGKTLFIEGGSTGTGLEAVKAASKNGLFVTGMVSSEDRAKIVYDHGGIATINRKDKSLNNCFSKVPEDHKKWAKWEKEGENLLSSYKKQNHGKLADYVISHAGEIAFPRSFQLLADHGILTFYGGSTGYHFTFMGKKGTENPETMLHKAKLTPGENVLIYYGIDPDSSLDPIGLECIEAARDLGGHIAICTQTDTQREFIKSMGFGESIAGVFSIEELKRREGNHFQWPKTMPSLPNPRKETEAFKEGVRWYQEHIFKPFASQVGKILKTATSSLSAPDLIIERAAQDTLALSTMVVKSNTGRVIYVEDMSNKRYSFYAPQVWMRQRRIYMPTANIFGTHLSNAYEIQAMNELVTAGFLSVDDPYVIEFTDLPQAHQEMWENRHRASNYLLNHALPQTGLKTKDALYHAWSLRGSSLP